MSKPDLGVAPLCDALPAEEMTTGSGRGVSPLLQAEDAADDSGTCALRTLTTGYMRRLQH